MHRIPLSLLPSHSPLSPSPPMPPMAAAGECIHKEPPTDYAEHLVSVDEGILTSLRNHLKKNKFHNITCLLDAFQHLDNVSGYIEHS